MIHNFIDGKTNPVVKGSSWTSRRFGVQHNRQSVAMKGKVSLLFLSWVKGKVSLLSFHGYWLTMVLNTDTETSWSPTTTFYHRICLNINKIVYHRHLLVSFEELLSLRLSDHFALVVGCINNNWLNLWRKKMRVRCSQAFRLLPQPFSSSCFATLTAGVVRKKY